MPPEVIAEDVATTERNRLGLGDGPIPNLRELLESDVGLRIFYMDLPSRVAARSDLSEGQLARFLRVDRLEARRVTTELANGPVVSDEGTVGTLPLDLGETLPVRGA